MQVGVYDGANNLKTGGSPVLISMAIDANPGGGTLSGTTTDVPTSAGIATFADLSIDEPGDGYTLAASASGLGSTTSDHVQHRRSGADVRGRTWTAREA